MKTEIHTPGSRQYSDAATRLLDKQKMACSRVGSTDEQVEADQGGLL